MALWTFLDAGVLIAGARGEDADRERALQILADSGRSFVASSFLFLEVAAKATFNKRLVESAFYDRFFRDAKWVPEFERVDAVARSEAEKHGLGAMDALHLAAAHVGGAIAALTLPQQGAHPLKLRSDNAVRGVRPTQIKSLHRRYSLGFNPPSTLRFDNPTALKKIVISNNLSFAPSPINH